MLPCRHRLPLALALLVTTALPAGAQSSNDAPEQASRRPTRPEIQLLGPLTAKDEELGEVVARLRKAAGVAIQITDPLLERKLVSVQQRAPARLGDTLRALAIQSGGELVIDTKATGETPRLRIQPKTEPKAEARPTPEPAPATKRAEASPRPPVTTKRAYTKPPRDINMEAKYRALGRLCYSRQMKQAEAKATEVLDVLGYRGTRYECWVHDKLAAAYDGLSDRANAIRCYRLAIASSDPGKGAYQHATKRLQELGVPATEGAPAGEGPR